MEIALIEARKAYDIGEIPVGCVIVNSKKNEIIACTHNMVEQYQNPNLHAEVLAINIACSKKKAKSYQIVSFILLLNHVQCVLVRLQTLD